MVVVAAAFTVMEKTQVVLVEGEKEGEADLASLIFFAR